MRTELRSRFKDAPWFPTEKDQVFCLIGGAGGIGSWLTFLLARVGYTCIVYDYDRVEQHNIGGQLYSVSDIGAHKVEALRTMILRFSGLEIEAISKKYEANSMTSLYVFSAFDNMKARKDMFETWYEANKDNPQALFMDGRLLMEQMQIFCVSPNDADEYRKRLFEDKDIPDENCTLKQTSHSAAMIASKMVGFFTNHIANLRLGTQVRTVPFYEEFFIPLNMTS